MQVTRWAIEHYLDSLTATACSLAIESRWQYWIRFPAQALDPAVRRRGQTLHATVKPATVKPPPFEQEPAASDVWTYLHRPIVVGCLLILVVLLGLTGCNGSNSTELRIAVNPWPGYGYFAVAQERGFLSTPGTPQLEIIETASLSDSLRAFERGQADLIGGTLAELADINSHGRRAATAILVLNRSIGGDMIVSTDDIASVEELKGKRVALEPASANVLVLAAAISLDGLALDQVELVPLPQGEMPEALAKGKVDAAITYPPVAQQLFSQPGVHRLFDTGSARDAVIDVLIVSNNLIKDHPRAIDQLLAAHDQALAWSRENPDDARRLLTKHTGLSDDEMLDIQDAIEMVSIEEQQHLWAPNGPLAISLHGASQVLGRLHEDMSAIENVDAMLDATFVRRSETP